MAEGTLEALGAVLTRWTVGASAASTAPNDWREALGDEPDEAELRLLALSAQFLGLAVVGEPKGALVGSVDVPTLAVPTLPASLRPLARRVMAATQGPARRVLPHFLAVRGWTMHPADWMPPANDDDAPDVYAAWRDWASRAGGARSVRAADELTATNWADWWPAARKTALVALRRRDPAAARAVLEAKLASESGDARLRLLGVMAEGLSEADVEFLEALAASDRAPKVKAFAASLLARLGRSGASAEDAAELAGYFTVQIKGLLRRSRVIEFQNTKTPAQRQRRGALMEQVDLGAFSAALGLDDTTLLEAWRWDVDGVADLALLGMIERGGSDALVAATAKALASQGGAASGGFAILAPRLTGAQRAAAAGQMLRADQIHFGGALEIAQGLPVLDDPFTTPAAKRLLELLERSDAKPTDGAEELLALGLLASRDGARRAVDRLTGAGLLLADARLDMIRLNAALDEGDRTR